MPRFATRLTGAYLALVSLSFVVYALDTQWRGRGAAAMTFGPLLLLLGFPWSWLSTFVASGDLAVVMLFAALAMNALLIFLGSAWWAQRGQRDQPT